MIGQLTRKVSDENQFQFSPSDKKLNKSYLRIFIGDSTSVVEKKPISLRDALASRLKSRNLDIEKCSVFLMHSKAQLDWTTEMSTIEEDNISVTTSDSRNSSCASSPAIIMDSTFRSYNATHLERSISATHSLPGEASEKEASPLFKSLPSSFLRIYIDSSTTVIEKKKITLKEALYSKLKSRNLDTTRCAAYDLYTNAKIDWEIEIDQIEQNDLIVNELHSFVKKSSFADKNFFLIRNCDCCGRRFFFNVYTNSCKKCDYTLCQGKDCKKTAEQLRCDTSSPKTNSDNPTYNCQKYIYNNSSPSDSCHHSVASQSQRKESFKRKWLNYNYISEQILPVNEIPHSTRSRSFSEPEVKCSLNTLNASVQVSTNIIQQITPQKTKIKKLSKRDSLISWEIPYNRIKINESQIIGQGAFGIVHQGRDFYHGIVAIKILNVKNPTPQQVRAFRNEVAILKSTRHDNILLFIGCILKPKLAIVTEWCPGSSLYRHVHVEEVPWKNYQLLDIAKQTSVGMEYLHARDILHRDLKSNNIFLIPKSVNSFYHQHEDMKRYFKPRVESSSLLSSSKPEWTVKIGDFGLATVSTSSWLQRSNASALHKPTGSILWMAPEIITQRVENPYTQKSDVYSYAVVLYELFSGALPYANKEQNMILFLVGSGRLKLNPKEAVKDDTPQEIIDLIVTCSQYDREQRFDFIRINEILRKIKLINSQIMIQNKSLVRSQSVPNLNTSSKSSDLSDINLSEDYDLSQNEDEEEEEYDDDLMNGMEIINQVSPQSSLVAVASPSTFSQLSQNEFIYE